MVAPVVVTLGPDGGVPVVITAGDRSAPWHHGKCVAWVTVVDSPYFALSGAEGKFTIKNVPAGKYTLEAAHRKLGTQTAEIEVKDDGAVQNFTFEPKQ